MVDQQAVIFAEIGVERLKIGVDIVKLFAGARLGLDIHEGIELLADGFIEIALILLRIVDDRAHISEADGVKPIGDDVEQPVRLSQTKRTRL